MPLIRFCQANMSTESSIPAVVPVVPIGRGKKALKKPRPAFRPKSKKTSSRIQQPSASAGPSRKTNAEVPNAMTVRASEQETRNEDPDFTGNDVSPTPTLTKRKKRKATIAIGASRTVQEDEVEAPPPQEQEAAVAPQPSIVAESTLPPALPGQLTLQSFCSVYRSKDKRPQQTQTQAEAPPQTDEEAATTTAGPVVQVINGEIVLQESSMMVRPRRTVQEVEEEFQHVVEEENHTSVVGASYNSFVTRRAPQHWTVDETKLFYDALRQVGTDFATMVAFFKTRTRKQLKRKYQVESSRNPQLVAMTLKPESRVPLDLTVFNVTADDIANVQEQVPLTDNVPGAIVETETITMEQADAVAGTENEPIVETMESAEQKQLISDGVAANNVGAFKLPEKPITLEQNESYLIEGEPVVQDEAFVEESFVESQAEKASTVIPLALAPTKQKVRSKRPKFKAKRGRARAK